MSVDAALGTRPYVTALKYRQLTPLYDPVIRWLFREHTMKSRLVDQVAPRPHENVLDIGCGTGTLAILLKSAEPAANVVGVDGDPAVVEIARRKTATIGLEIRFDGGMAYDFYLPVRVGDTLVGSPKVLDISLKEGKTKMMIIRFETSYFNQNGDLVAKSYQTLIGRQL